MAQDGELPALSRPPGSHTTIARSGWCRSRPAGLWNVAQRLPAVFPSLTEMTRFFHVGGDGQEQDASNGQALPEPLEVGVMNGTRRWSAPPSSSRSSPGPASSPRRRDGPGGAGPLVVKTDAAGIAACGWTLSTTLTAQQVEARLLGPGQTRPSTCRCTSTPR